MEYNLTREGAGRKQRKLTALEAAMTDGSGPRSPAPFNSPLSLLPSSSSVTETAPGPFFFFSLARIDDSLSGNGGISSKTVAWEKGDQNLCKWNSFTRLSLIKAGGWSYQDIRAGNRRELQILHSSLLQFNIWVADLAIAAQHLLDCGLSFWEQVNKLDVSRQKKGTGRHRAQVELRVEKVELDQGTREKKITR